MATTDSDEYISDKPYAASFGSSGSSSSSSGGGKGSGLASMLLMKKYTPGKHKGKAKKVEAKKHAKRSR